MNIKPGPTFLSLVPVKTPLKKRTAWFCTSITQVTFAPVRPYISVTWLTSDHTQKINKLADSGGPWVVSRARGDNHPEGWVFGSCTSPYFIFLASLPPPSTSISSLPTQLLPQRSLCWSIVRRKYERASSWEPSWRVSSYRADHSTLTCNWFCLKLALVKYVISFSFPSFSLSKPSFFPSFSLCLYSFPLSLSLSLRAFPLSAFTLSSCYLCLPSLQVCTCVCVTVCDFCILKCVSNCTYSYISLADLSSEKCDENADRSSTVSSGKSLSRHGYAAPENAANYSTWEQLASPLRPGRLGFRLWFRPLLLKFDNAGRHRPPQSQVHALAKT